MDSNSYLYLTQNNQKCIKICVTGTRDKNAALAILMNSFVETPSQNYDRQCKKGIYFYRTGYTKLDINKVFDLLQGIVHGPFHHEDCDKGTFVKRGKTKDGIRVTFRTKSNHGPTIELNVCFPQPDQKGEIIKIRIRGKLIFIQLHFRKVF